MIFVLTTKYKKSELLSTEQVWRSKICYIGDTFQNIQTTTGEHQKVDKKSSVYNHFPENKERFINSIFGYFSISGTRPKEF